MATNERSATAASTVNAGVQRSRNPFCISTGSQFVFHVLTVDKTEPRWRIALRRTIRGANFRLGEPYRAPGARGCVSRLLDP